MYLFSYLGFNMKVLLDRIDEFWVDDGFGIRDDFLKNYNLGF